MPDLLLELLSEEIPAGMQSRAADDLKNLITNGLVEAGLTYEGARAHATPRRLVLSIEGLPVTQPDVREERKGPRVGAPEKAVEGFMRAAGLADIKDAQVNSDAKGDFYVAVIERPGRTTPDVIADMVLETVKTFPWPKSMRWGSGGLRWVRPLHSIVCTFDGETVPFEIDGIAAGNTTRGHRFMGPDEPLKVRRYDDYETALEKAHVMLDASRRADVIAHDARDLALAQGLELIEDARLCEETAGLVEWPVVLMGVFDEGFLDVPPEVVITSIKTHQKCFALKDPKTERLANRFLLVANLVARDGGNAIVEGNQRVIAARLSDAKFFWDQDRKTTLENYAKRLSGITYHEKLGSVADKAARVEKLAGELAGMIGADPEKSKAAARLAKADLVTGMVGEFPGLQGIMGRYYAREQGVDGEVADAIAEHYRPQGPADALPATATGQVLALADKLDTLVGFWSIDEKPTGSRDPFGLRRAALGVIRIILEHSHRLPIKAVVPENVSAALLEFFADRLKVHLRDSGIAHDRIDAVFSLPEQDDILMIVKRVQALDGFLKTPEGENLLAGHRRAVNIVRIEEKKAGPTVEFSGDVDPKFFEHDEEKNLFGELEKARLSADKALKAEEFTAAMAAMAPLREPVDAFFEHVTVNADNEIVRRNRLCMLNQIRATLGRVADFSKIEG